MSDLKKSSFILDVNDGHETWLHLREIENPVGSYYLSASTVFARSKDPDAHVVKFGFVIQNRDELRNLGAFLLDF